MESQKPSGASLGYLIPVILNLIAMVALYGLELSKVSSGYRAEEVALGNFFFDLLGMLLVDGVLLVLALFISTKWARGFFIAGMLVLLIGLGTCGYNLSHMHVNGALPLPRPLKWA